MCWLIVRFILSWFEFLVVLIVSCVVVLVVWVVVDLTGCLFGWMRFLYGIMIACCGALVNGVGGVFCCLVGFLLFGWVD